MKRVIIVVLSLLLAPTIVQADVLPLPLPDPELGTIGVAIRVRSEKREQFLTRPKMSAVQVYFVRLDEGVDMFSSDNVIRSNFSREKQLYLLNCQPGRYVAVGAELFYGGDNTRRIVYFEIDLISKTEVVVEADEMAFMGDFFVDLNWKIDRYADKAQSHYFRLLDPIGADIGLQFDIGLQVRMYAMNSRVYRGALKRAKRTPETEASFWTVAGEEIFKEFPAWAAKSERAATETLE